MNGSGRLPGLRTVLPVGVLYLSAGITFGAFAGHAGSNQMRVMWRIAAWVISAAAFAAHIGFEHFRRHSSPRTSASRAALAVALGAFGLAVAANINAGVSFRRALALVIWPVMTALPAFVVALAAAVLLSRARRAD